MLNKGYFTIPGEAGYEELTLKLAEKWGADVVRDSDGTTLSDKILSSGLNVYSTLCLIRSDNAWAKQNTDKLQQNFLMSDPVIAQSNTVTIDLLKGYFREQFRINTNDDSKIWWQVFDRTSAKEIPAYDWEFNDTDGTVTVYNTVKNHFYTVNFLAYRIWEAISMYNHITNNWGDREHLMPVDPIYPEAQERILSNLEKWLENHPKTDVVRFTSMFYNFCWLWGDDQNLRYRYSDWGSYDFSVSPYALTLFEKQKGYRLTSEDFINAGFYNNTHNVPTRKYLDWIDFINDFVISFGKKCVDLAHHYGKKAYVFYDDHWIGIEPYGHRFAQFGFDGIIKCVFNAFEARKCAGVSGIKTHELRLHPYLFPTGLKGEPTFKEGGTPTRDAKNFWVNIRRALLRSPVQRIGLGGYLHLVEGFEDFQDYISELAQEFRLIKSLHESGKPYTVPCKTAVLHSWGKLRSWICSGHMHEHPELDLNHVNEALAGLPVDVVFISFDDILKHGIPDDVKVIINCGRLDSAWSGGDHWKNPEVVARITEWVSSGGGFIGINEPSAAKFSSRYFQLSHILGVEREIGLTLSKGKYNYTMTDNDHFILKDSGPVINLGIEAGDIYAVNANATVLADSNRQVRIAVNSFGSGRGVYFSGYRVNPQNIRMLFRAILWAAKQEEAIDLWIPKNINTECAYFPSSKKLVVINNGGEIETTFVKDETGNIIKVTLDEYGIKVIETT